MSKRFRKSCVVVVCLVLIWGIFLLAGPQKLDAQTYPTKPVNLITSGGAGSTIDITTRMFIGKAKEHLGQQIIFQMKPGGGGVVASEEIYNAKPDGYSLLMPHTNANSIYPATHPKDAKTTGPEGFEAVCLINQNYGFWLVSPDAPYNTFKEMIAWIKANPGKFVFGSTAAWSSNDIAWRELVAQTGIQARVVYLTSGSSPMISILGGHVSAVRQAAAQSIAQVKAGKVKAVAWSGPKRHRDLPNVPTEKEEGFDSRSGFIWKGIAAPRGTPRPIVDKLALSFKKMLEEKEAIAQIEKIGDEFGWMGPDEFKDFWQKDYEYYKEMAKRYVFKK